MKDAADAFISILNSDLQGAVNIGAGDARPLRSILEELERVLSAAGMIDYAPVKDGDAQVVVADIGRIRDELGWRPQFKLNDGLYEIRERIKGDKF